ncbi:DUF6612 family protein [Halorhabdus sp. CBA1104]|uniref:DUF6612 family protein n=1 Tax=Halorhabdus sp. CBA1104 TaxID=1380432 RepID=UPI0012B402C2|nr:DUF6612 family protein [Halorhabdus sp. CBA1104]
MESTETFHVDSNTTTETNANGRTQTQTVLLSGQLDRATEELQINQTVEARGATQKIGIYLIDGTLYQHGAAYTAQYGSEWVQSNQTTGVFSQIDSLSRQRSLLANATVTRNGTETVKGTETHVLEADVDIDSAQAALQAQLQQQVPGNTELNVSDVTQRLWVNPETNRPIKTVTEMDYTVRMAGQSINQSMQATMTFDYERSVSITLPDGAEDAVDIANQ